MVLFSVIDRSMKIAFIFDNHGQACHTLGNCPSCSWVGKCAVFPVVARQRTTEHTTEHSPEHSPEQHAPTTSYCCVCLLVLLLCNTQYNITSNRFCFRPSTFFFSFCSVCFLCRHLFGDKRSQLLATAGWPACGVFGLLGGHVQPSILVVLAVEGASQLVNKGVCFPVRRGTHVVQEGVVCTFSRFAGVQPPPRCSGKGGSICPLLRCDPVSRNTVPKKTKT